MRDGKRKKAPNLLFVMTDQQRFDTLSVNGAPICRTPNLDRLASKGANFTRAFTNAPLCSPARGVMMTGRYPHSNGLTANTHYSETPTPGLKSGEVMISEILAEAGYRCGYIGKWHLSFDQSVQRGFSEWDVTHRSYGAYLQQRGVDPGIPGEASHRTLRVENAPLCGTSPLSEDDFRDVFIIRKATEVLKMYHERRPFALWCSIPGPHFPLEIPEPYASLYDPASVPENPSFDDPIINKPKGQKTHSWLQLGAHLDWSAWQRVIAHYWGYVTLLDKHIGVLLDTLEELDMASDTLIVFLSDHGEMAGSHHMFDKGPFMYEDVMHIPMILSYPGVIPESRTVSDAFVSHLDIAPTILDYLGQPIPENVQGKSLRPVIEGQTSADRDCVFAECSAGDIPNRQENVRMIRTARWKYCYRPDDDMDELYDLDSDPYEMCNRIDDAGCLPVIRDLRSRFAEWMRSTRDSLPPPALQ